MMDGVIFFVFLTKEEERNRMYYEFEAFIVFCGYIKA